MSHIKSPDPKVYIERRTQFINNLWFIFYCIFLMFCFFHFICWNYFLSTFFFFYCNILLLIFSRSSRSIFSIIVSTFVERVRGKRFSKRKYTTSENIKHSKALNSIRFSKIINIETNGVRRFITGIDIHNAGLPVLYRHRRP